jgi:glutathione S-transferase
MGTPVLYIGNKNYSSWSLRPWLALTWGGIAFEERVIALGGDGYGAGEIKEVVAVSPSGRVPVLHVDGLRIWDSVAICEWAAEKKPALWPSDPGLRAVCRSVVSEMHSGFAAVRRDLSMNIRRRTTAREWPEDTQRDIGHILAVWTALRMEHRSRGPFLFGERSIADAFFAPVCTRFRTYGVTLEGEAAAYSETVLADEAFRKWEADAIAETWTIASTDAL